MTKGPQQGPINPQLQAMMSGTQQGQQTMQAPASASNPTALQQPTDPAGPLFDDCIKCLQKLVDALSQMPMSSKSIIEAEKAKLSMRKCKMDRQKEIMDRQEAAETAVGGQ